MSIVFGHAIKLSQSIRIIKLVTFLMTQRP